MCGRTATPARNGASWTDHRVYGVEDANGSHYLTIEDLQTLVTMLTDVRAETQYRIVWGDDGVATGAMSRDRALRKSSAAHDDVVQTRTVVAPICTPWIDTNLAAVEHEPSICDTPGPGHDCPVCQA